MDFVFLLLGGFFLFACLRGMWSGEVLAFVLLPLPLAILGFWIWQRMKPALSLTIGPNEIVLGRPGDERREVIGRDATGWLRIEQEEGGFWDLIAHDGDEEVERMGLSGFPLLAIAEACEAHGWPVPRRG